MHARDLLVDAYGRLPVLVESAVRGLTAQQLHWAPAPGANTIGWLVWHLTRVQDGHVAELAGVDQVWSTPGWPERFGLPAGALDTGYGYTAAQVGRVRPAGADVLMEYFGSVYARTRDLLDEVTAADLDRIVDERWDPPVTLGVRLVSVLEDDLQHVGQAAYVRGILPRGTAA